MRQELIGSACEQCGSSDRTLVLQHMWHPPSYAQVLTETAAVLGLPRNDERVEARAYQIYEANHERYISGRDAKTFCDKCAYLWDKHGLKLCSECRESYHPMRYKLCKRCAQRERDRKIYGKDLFESLS